MLESEPALLASRHDRLAAACLNVAPALAPLIVWSVGSVADSESDYGVLGYGVWSVAALLIVVATNTVLLLRSRQSLGLAYLGLAYEGSSVERMLFGKLVVWGLPWLLVPSIAVPLAGLANWLVWLGPGRRTLADLIGDCRVVERQDFRRRWFLLELLMIGPILVLLPAYAELRGGVAGGAAALALVLGVMAWRRRST